MDFDKIDVKIDNDLLDASERILLLSDLLSEEIILENIENQLQQPLDTLAERFNYITLFKEKYTSIDREDELFDLEYIIQSLNKVSILTARCLYEKYGVEMGEDLDYAQPEEYLTDMETLYEFLFVRHYENLVEYIKFKLNKERADILSKYSELIQSEKHSKDVFVVQAKKKFKNNDDVVILHFLNEIIHDIVDSTSSAYTLYQTIVNIDLYEEFNSRMNELIENYGNKLVLNDDEESARLYLAPLKDQNIFSEVRNAVLISYLESCEIDE